MNRTTWAIGYPKPLKPAWPGSSFFGASFTRMETLDRNFADFLRLLNAHGVEYLIVGGYAVGFHGFVRATGDLDVFVSRDPRNADELVAVLKEFGFDLPDLTAAVFVAPGKIVRIGVPPIRLEIMNEISGVRFDECYGKRVKQTIDGVPVAFIDRESLLANKRAAGRPKDLADIAELTRNSGP